MSWFSSPRVSFLQTGQTRSQYSVTVTGAWETPSLSPVWGMPARSVETSAWAGLAAALVTVSALEGPDAPADMVTVAAMTTKAPKSARLNGRNAFAGCGRWAPRLWARPSWRAAFFCSLGEAMSFRVEAVALGMSPPVRELRPFLTVPGSARRSGCHPDQRRAGHSGGGVADVSPRSAPRSAGRTGPRSR